MPLSQGGLYLFRQLEQRLPNLLMPRRAELPFEAGVDVPTMPDLAPGAYEVIQTVVENVGNAKILADGAFDFPVVDASASEDRYRVLMTVAGFTIGFQAKRHEAYAATTAIGQQMQRQYDIKMTTCVRAIQEKQNRIAAYGEASLGVTGLLNNANVTPDNNSFNPYTATPAELKDFLIGLAKDFDDASDTTFLPTTALVSKGLWYRMVETVLSGTETTVKDHVQTALKNEGINFEFRKRRECDSAKLEANGVHSPGTNKDRIVLYTLDPEVVERHTELIQMAPPEYAQTQGLNTLYPMFGCTTPTIVNYTTAIQYTDVAKAA